MSIPIQVVPAALDPAAEVADDSPSTNQRHDRTLHLTEEDDSDDHFDPERTVCQTASASSSLYKEDVFSHGLHPGHHHSHGDLFPDTALDQLAEIDEKEWERKASTARRRSSAANCTRPKKADLVEAGEGKEARKEVPSDEEKGVKKEDWTYPDGGLKAWLVVLGCFLVAGGGMGFGLVRPFPPFPVSLVPVTQSSCSLCYRLGACVFIRALPCPSFLSLILNVRCVIGLPIVLREQPTVVAFRGRRVYCHTRGWPLCFRASRVSFLIVRHGQAT